MTDEGRPSAGDDSNGERELPGAESPTQPERDKGSIDSGEQFDLAATPDLRSPGRTARSLAWDAIIRGALAFLLFAVFAATVYAGLHAAGHSKWGQFKDALNILLPAETGLLGAAVGYYYGARRR